MSESHVVCITTVSNIEEAKKIARAVVDEKLAACVNIINGVQSIYTWEGKVNEDDEVILLMKTRQVLFDELESLVKSLHSYECPEIIMIPIVGGFKPYLTWIDENTK
ncbi:MAG: divalent-cation tolerance protein CutA [Promethearchaeota archaeon]